MSGFFKKALSLFVEIDETAQNNETIVNANNTNIVNNASISQNINSSSFKPSLSKEDMDKFEKHFEQLMNQANMPGPDYFEFWKMLEALENHVPDENARLSAVFASLSVQGLTKDKLLQTASTYKDIIEKDKANFDTAALQKSKSDIDARQQMAQNLEKKINEHAETIQKYTKEITEFQLKIQTLKKEIVDEQNRIKTNKDGYYIAFNAMLQKITMDIQKIKSQL